jgi:small subunit ribosomal protein S17
MADEENKDAVDETTQDEDAQSEGPASEADASGDDTSAEASDTSEAASNPESSPPSEEASEPEQAQVEPSDPGRGAEESDGIDDDLPWKERRRLERSRRPHEAGPQLSAEERAAKRAGTRRAKAELRRKQRAAARAERGAAGTGTEPAERDANAAKVRQGVVVSDKGEKSITVRIDIVRRHPTYEKVVHRSRTLHAHDERNEAGEGDTVRVVETRPLSKTKRWRLVEVLEKAK